tara:strand:- start:11277 stop:12002 length:726 start_codon:yes stop_codon:yes gene_type:complete
MRGIRRLLTTLSVPCLILAGCAAGTGETAIFPGLQGFLNRHKAPDAVTRYAALSQTNAPGMIARGKGNEASGLLRLQTVSQDGVESWLAHDGSVISMRNGMVIASRGLGDDMMSGDASQTRALLAARAKGHAKRFVARLDGDDQIVQSSFVCDVVNAGPVQLDAPGRKISTTYMTETCYGADYSFRNLYWLGDEGRIWKSRQLLGGLVGPVDFQVLDAAGLAVVLGRQSSEAEPEKTEAHP